MRRTYLGVLALVVSCLATVLLAGTAGAVDTCDGLAATIDGTSGNDVIVGTAGPDVIAGLGGNDTLSGAGGDDRICGGLGNDTIYGEVDVSPPAPAGGGNDRLFGEEGNDTISGNFGSRTIQTGTGIAAGANYIEGGPGADTLYGSSRELTFQITAVNADLGGGGDDTVIGGDGNDLIYGNGLVFTLQLLGDINLEGGGTIIEGGSGQDTIYGDWGSYVIANGSALTSGFRDTITAGDDNDLIIGDFGTVSGTVTPLLLGMSDSINGGAGTDQADGGPGLLDSCINTEIEINCEL